MAFWKQLKERNRLHGLREVSVFTFKAYHIYLFTYTGGMRNCLSGKDEFG